MSSGSKALPSPSMEPGPSGSAIFVGAALYQIAMLLADLAYAALDPRVRL